MACSSSSGMDTIVWNATLAPFCLDKGQQSIPLVKIYFIGYCWLMFGGYKLHHNRLDVGHLYYPMSSGCGIQHPLHSDMHNESGYWYTSILLWDNSIKMHPYHLGMWQCLLY